VVLLISVFFSWYTASVGPFSVSGSGWDTTDVAKLVFLLALVAGAAWVLDLAVPGVDLPFPAATVALVAGVAAAVLVLYRIISKPHAGELNSAAAKAAGISYGTAWGIWVALLAAIAVAVGAYLYMNERA
jgi:hypothetical protein